MRNSTKSVGAMKVDRKSAGFELVDMVEGPSSTKRGNDQAKRNFYKVLKMGMFVLCLAGFGYQATEFITNFYTHPTVLNMAITRLDEIPTPALTYCSKYFYRFDLYCKRYKDRCQKPKDVQAFCLKYPMKCDGNTTEAVTPIIFPGNEDNYLNDLVMTTLEAIPFFEADTDEYFESPFYFKNPKSYVFEVCYNYRNGLGEKGLRTLSPRSHRANFWTLFYVKFPEHKNIYFEEEPYGSVYIYSPFETFSMNSESVTLKLKSQYSINIGLEEERLLPYPYETDCVDYEAMWMANNMSGPISREMCEYSCVRNETEKHIKFFQTGYENVLFDYHCDSLLRMAEGEASEEDKAECACRDKCKEGCLKLTFSFSVLETNYSKIRKYVRDLNGASVFLYIESSKVRVLSYKPQYMDVEIFSYIGGFLGCWLGISLWTFHAYIGKGFSALVCRCPRRENSKKSTSREAPVYKTDEKTQECEPDRPKIFQLANNF